MPEKGEDESPEIVIHDTDFIRVEDLPESIQELYKELPLEKRSDFLAVISQKIFIKKDDYSGPLPPPDILKGYDIVKDGPERIFMMVEKEQAFQQNITEYYAVSDFTLRKRGQWMGLSLGIMGMAVATYLGINNHDVLAGVIASTVIVGLVSVFVIGKTLNEIPQVKEKELPNEE